MTSVWLVLTGFMAGIFSGLFGIGGATIVIPVLVLGFGLSQHLAQGTTLAMMIPPIGLLAAWHYWKNGQVNFPWAMLLCVGFFFGGLIGAYWANLISPDLLRKLFGVVFLMISLRLIFW
ncbi:permease [candidate division WOR-1 bacterium RIFOXYA12_FULL_52_29]|uniref:Probable membrane transporter protein n=1 Tax=candidate division WOR-1 bacterium RIFOXYC12_FULL_54_18 TaxID=1802584 RepID=A0A1F4T622_UNCSA|nr:MAG: permease [candidate division WOR-1 bacterium RIFOXYA2_FULL_51_19]OGC17788.1 MAG: permease [candidate division WOR-1 bacterium RIFOXYA12_FULL_52_29]OGC26645.1 MAG: permease [candidate division WOR-1 bacterium RIFOXYB2_FULL_45_9]OGC28205.1 MAG: permease [candidate division WOR-1 bacterium RIFOXYC12_FULL_54_18]OGC29507.1 MAG: permease [candidate division WOR-1 bacterium RIFOXYB12_FULL_52_16]